MANWSKEYTPPANINNGNEFTEGDTFSRPALNGFINNSFWTTDFVKRFQESGDYSSTKKYQAPIIVKYLGSAYMCISSVEISNVLPTDTTKWVKVVDKGDTGNGIVSISKTGSSGTNPVVDEYTIQYDNGRTTTFNVTNGVKGDTGNGIKSSNSKYQASDNGTTVPTGVWLDTIPTVGQGEFLWTRTTLIFDSNATNISYTVSRQGRDNVSIVAIDNLTSTSATDALSANQGRVLNELIGNTDKYIGSISAKPKLDNFVVKTWNGLNNFTGIGIWTYNGKVYYSRSSDQYELQGDTWVVKTWNGLNNFYGIWTHNGKVYYSRGSDQYELQGDTWVVKTWNGLNDFYGSGIWTHNGKVYYSDGYNQHELQGDTWVVKTWNGLNNFTGSGIWTHNGKVYYSMGSDQYELQGDIRPNQLESIANSLDNMVTINSQQTIDGEKTFNNLVKIKQWNINQSSDGSLEFIKG